MPDPQGRGTARDAPRFSAASTGSTRWQRVRGIGASAAAVTAATLMFLGICLGFLMNTPVLQSPDEVFHYDRIMAAEHGNLLPDPGSFHVSRGSRRAESHYVPQNTTPALQRFAITPAPQRTARESYDQLGGDARSPTIDIPNYISQHPPLYYALMGGLTWLIPGSDTMHEDQLMWILKVINILLMLPLPYLMYRSARNLIGDNAIARASAFLPLLVPGLARSAAGINNDNLAILIGAALVAFSIRIAQGDLGRRTALWVSGLAIAGSLTKATVLFVLIIVPIAYLIGAARARRLPDRPVLAVLVVGALATAAWWVRNVIEFGQFQPDGYGDRVGIALGAPWPPGQHDSITVYLDTVRDTVPSRFWGALGLLEPPALPEVMIWSLTGAAVVCAGVTLLVLRGRRWTVAAAVVTPLAAIAMVCFQAYRHWLHYQSIPGLQGRYAYPAVFGIVFGFAVVAAVVLGRRRRFAPALIAGFGTLVTGWGLFTSAEYFWLPQGTRLRPTTLVKALRQLFSWSAFGPVGTAAVLVVAGLCFVAGVVLLVVAVRRDTDRRSLFEVLHPEQPSGPGPAAEPVEVPAGAVESRLAGRRVPRRTALAPAVGRQPRSGT